MTRKPASRAAASTTAATGAVRTMPSHSPRPRTSRTSGWTPSRRARRWSPSDGGGLQQPLLLDGAQHGERRGAGDRAAAEGRAVVALGERARGPAVRDDRADRQPAAERLGERHDVGDDAGRGDAAGEPGADPADAALHLVEVEQRAVLVAGLAGGLEEAGRRDDDPGLAHDRLEDDGGGAVGHGGAQGGGVAVGDERDRTGQGLERRALRGLAGDGERAHRAAVERALAGDPAATGPQPARQLQRRLVRLGAGVGEQHPAVRSGADERLEPLGELDARLVRGEVARVAERADLPGDGLDDGRVGVAEQVDGDAAEQVDVLAAVDVPDGRAAPPREHHRRGAVVAHERGVPAGLPLRCRR